MSKALSTLPVGTLVKDSGTKYNDEVIVWKIADKEYSGYPVGSVTLISDKILTLKCFDAMEPENPEHGLIGPSKTGNANYIYSNIRQWMNSDAGAGEWYLPYEPETPENPSTTEQNETEAPPTSANVADGINEYDQEAGFLFGFSSNMSAALLSTMHYVGKADVNGGMETCNDKIFFASCNELGLDGFDTGVTYMELFSRDMPAPIAYPTAECVSKSEYEDVDFNTEKPYAYWTCDSPEEWPRGVYCVKSDGKLSYAYPYSGLIGARPLCNLSSKILVHDNPDTDGAYILFAQESGLYIKQNGEWSKAVGVAAVQNA